MPFKDPEAERAYQKAYRQRPEYAAKRKGKPYRMKPKDPKALVVWRERKRVLSSKWYAANKEKVQAESRRKHQAKLEAALGRPKPEVCDACGTNEAGKIVFDHCHARNQPRGWLCDWCNVALGLVKDDIDRLRKLIAYLERAGTK